MSTALPLLPTQTDIRAAPYAPAISDERLFKLNRTAAILHFVQGGLMVGAYYASSKISSFSRPINYSYVTVDETNQFTQNSKFMFDAKIGLITPFFLFLSALAHAIAISPYYWDTYIANLGMEINRLRWYEYAISSSLMIVMIAILFGVWDFGSLLAIVGCNASMNLFGLMMEEINMAPTSTNKRAVRWSPFWLGCFAGIVPWVSVMIAFLGGGNFGDIPGFVYGILGSYFFFFNLFPLNMVMQFLKKGKWEDYRYGEVVYMFLSLFAKSALAWLVFGGCMQPNGPDGN